MINELEAAAAEYRRATKSVDKARTQLAQAIVAAAESGMRQNEIVAITGYTRERVRQILDPDWQPRRKRSD